jgi:hypothetical protein
MQPVGTAYTVPSILPPMAPKELPAAGLHQDRALQLQSAPAAAANAETPAQSHAQADGGECAASGEPVLTEAEQAQQRFCHAKEHLVSQGVSEAEAQAALEATAADNQGFEWCAGGRV